jgi:hypothetical protein
MSEKSIADRVRFFAGGRRAGIVVAVLALAGVTGISSAGTPLPSTREDFDAPGTQPLGLATPLATTSNCALCHSGYGSPEIEPWRSWQGSMVAQAGRDPLMYAAMAVANQDVPHSGDLCIRCHMPKAWLEGRSIPEDASATTAADREGVQCSTCHRLVDPDGSPEAPAADAAILADLAAPVTTTGAGQMVMDPQDRLRGPFDVVADLGSDPHAPTRSTLVSPFHESSKLCGTCHNVLNPVFQRNMVGDYEVSPFGEAGDPALAFPEQHTYTEWELSEYASTGVVAPQFAGDGDGVDGDDTVGSCQSCHMPRVAGKAAWSGATRTNMPFHNLVGANTFVPKIIPLHPDFGSEVNATVLAEGAERALRMLRRAATVRATIEGGELKVRVTNESGHKLPTGYPDGRRMWLHVRAFDAAGALVFESGDYDEAGAEIDGYEVAPMDPGHDPYLHVWETHQGMSADVALLADQTAGPGFHLALNNVREFDNRIPPRGFSNDAFAAVDAEPVGQTYADGQYWDDVVYPVGSGAVRAEVVLYYQTTSKKYVEFLRDHDVTTSHGQTMYDLWSAAGKSAPEEMARVVVDTNAERVEGCRRTIDKMQWKYFRTFLAKWGACDAATAAGLPCDGAARDAVVAAVRAKVRAKIGGEKDRKCEGAGLTPASVGLGSHCPAPCAGVVLYDVDDAADCALCLAETLAGSALESAYGTTPPLTPGMAPAEALDCQRNLATGASLLAIKWTSARLLCARDNASGRNDPPVDCTADPKGKVGKAKAAALAKIAKCSSFTGLAGCADGAADAAAAAQCVENAVGAKVTTYLGAAFP